MGNSENSVRSKAPTVDVLIIGAGPAGLGVALGLCRQMHTAILFDSGVYRNAPAKEMHNVPTWDNKSGEEYRGTARMEVMGQYNTVQFVETTITQALQKEDGGGFFVRDSEHREWEGRKLVLATGVRDVFPDIDGYGDCWGRGM
jgi:thioredoxin reductase